MAFSNRPHMKTPNLDLMLARLQYAIEYRRSHRWKLRLWSEFIRARDAYRCVFCAQNHSSNPCIREVAAHHIIRRCVFPIAEFDTGNGVTLCSRCHAMAHSVFNRRPNLDEALNQRGGDDQDIMADLYGALEEDASARGILCDEFYYISDSVLTFFKQIQGFDGTIPLSGVRVGQANRIWRSPPPSYCEVLASCIGHELLSAWGRNRE